MHNYLILILIVLLYYLKKLKIII
ncbi:hypothetical protein Mgra_00001502 [Meloidogyne graminicola]|uniref:Uncharacterized protein n=1 Tax=Meloidogyne graminicola TaxID=189291 RepID=A0A8T0A109_9BILA|nr:hypothetical protein Mgra_00001502 [Meloidogyne graminicola]